jgi:hypothetical protein
LSNLEGDFILLIKLRDNFVLMAILIVSSLTVYGIQVTVFHRNDDTLFYLLQDLAFVPIQVLIVTLVINRFLNLIEKRKKIKKVNVIISTFFSDAGTNLITAIGRFNRNHDAICGEINIHELKKTRNRPSVKNSAKSAKTLTYDFYADPMRLDALAAVMEENKSHLLSMLENSNLLEHDSFTDMLWAVFHVADELKIRGDLKTLEQSDIDHLSNDLLRAYSALVTEWIQYILYLKAEYPFLYVAAIRKNPFQKAEAGELV